MLTLDLNKSARALRLSLDKAGVQPDIKVEIAFDIDVSGSFEHEHEEGTTSELLARLVPYGMVLDPDGMMDVFTFSGGKHHVHHVGTVTPAESEDYLRRKVVDRVPGWGGGTSYSYVLERNLQHFGWLPQDPQERGFFSRFFGRPQAPEPPQQPKRSLVLFVTDGENDASDEARTMRVLEQAEERGDRVYVLFMGFCDRNPDFKFIRKASERFRNTGAIIVRDLEGFVKLSDEEINARLLLPELVDWLKS